MNVNLCQAPFTPRPKVPSSPVLPAALQNVVWSLGLSFQPHQAQLTSGCISLPLGEVKPFAPRGKLGQVSEETESSNYYKTLHILHHPPPLEGDLGAQRAL